MDKGTKILLITLGVALAGGAIAVAIVLSRKNTPAAAPPVATTTSTTDVVKHGGIGSALTAIIGI